MSLLQNSNAISAGGYDINNSLRFRSSASAYLSRTPAGAGNRQIWTWSAWVKRGSLGSTQTLFGLFDYAGGGSTNSQQSVRFTSSDTIEFYEFVTPSYNGQKITTQVFRDPSAWYHIVAVWDTTQATASNRMKLYVNGTQVTAFGTSSDPSLNSNGQINRAFLTTIGGFYDPDFGAVTNLLDGYQADINFIDGSAKTPSDFGETDTTTGSWKPKAYTGTYGTNGFYLKFSDIATTSGSNAGLGKDFSGNANYWTTNNISVTAGTTYDAMIDSPTLTSATVANYCTLNPLRNTASTLGTFSNANLKISGTSGSINSIAAGTMAFSGKMYCEMTIQVRGNNTTTQGVGIVPISSNESSRAGTMSTGIYYLVDGNKRVTGTSSAYGSSYTSGDVIGIAVDTSAETVTFYKNNVSQGSISGTGVISAQVFPYIGFEDSGSPEITANFGQRPFAYTPPTGFVRLNTYNLPDSTILKGNKVMDATLYTGTGASLSITNAGAFKPDFVWVKSRSNITNNSVYDSVRGFNASPGSPALFTNLTDAEGSSTNTVSSANSNGFTISGSSNNLNTNAYTYVGWQWQAGQGTTSSNTNGSITSTVSVNATAGFSIVSWTANGTNGATIGHGLGVAPAMMIFKERSASGNNWSVYHKSIGNTGRLFLDLTNATSTSITAWNNTSPTSTVFTVGTSAALNTNGSTMIGYCWAEIAGFSKFGSYTGNGSTDGPFIYTGFRPKFIIMKNSSAVFSWYNFDTARLGYNDRNDQLYPNLSNAEDSSSGNQTIDILSNGFKIRNSTGNNNGNGNTIIYAAFAENPFKNANAR
jgi:hypothetical protein